MKWPQEDLGEDNYSRNYWSVADATVARYLTLPWRRAAVSSVRKFIDARAKEARGTDQRSRPPDSDQLRSWLDAHGLPDVVGVLLQDDSNSGISMGGALLAEATGARFCSSPTVLHWQMVGEVVENDPVAWRVLADLIARRISKRPRLRDDIRKVAQAIVRGAGRDAGGSSSRSDQTTISEMHRQWIVKPDLHEIWFGLRAVSQIMPFRSDWHIFDYLFEKDTAFAAELIETYGDPYQPAMILRFGTLDPHRRFSDWMRLIQVALPAFEANGAWNGRVLFPLLVLAAQDETRLGLAHRGEDDQSAERRDARLLELAEAVAGALWARSDGAAATLRWGGWLFRSVMSNLDSERIPFPRDSGSRSRPAWLTIEALVRSPVSTAWLDLRPADVAFEDELCLEAVRILAAQAHDRKVPGRDLLFDMLPNEPEDFLEAREATRRREIPSLFVIWGKRADAFGTRILAAALFDHDVAASFADMWRRTLTLREIAEHGHAFQSYDETYEDHSRRASDTIRFILALGINLIDYVQDGSQKVTFEDRRATTLALFSTLHDATREMLAIDPIGRRDMESVHDHLCIRRFLYEDAHGEKGALAAEPLAVADKPTAGDLLYERCEVSRALLGNLQLLRINGVSRDRIERALESVGVSLSHLIQQAVRLNAIDHNRVIDLTGFDASEIGGSSE